MSDRNIQIKHRIIIIELMIESHSTAFIKQIMIDRHNVNVSKRRIQKTVHKFKSEEKYDDGRPPKLSKRSNSTVTVICYGPPVQIYENQKVHMLFTWQ